MSVDSRFGINGSSLAIDLPENEVASAQIVRSSMNELTLILHGHAAFQYLHAGCAFNIFEQLQRSPGESGESLMLAAGLSPHGGRVLLFGLRSLGLVEETNNTLRNGGAIQSLFDRGDWPVFRATVMFHAEIVYPGEREFVRSLREHRNAGLSFLPGVQEHLYERLSSDAHLKQIFYEYMSLWTRHVLKFMLQTFDFDSFSTILDVGGGDGTASIAIANAFRRPTLTILEIPEMESTVRSHIDGLRDRISVRCGDMFSTEWPREQDCVLFLHQLVIWNASENELLLQRAYDSLGPGGTVLIVSSMADADEAGPHMAALDSAYFVAVAVGEGMIYPWTEYERLLRAVGFGEITFQRFPTWTPHGFVTARRL